jgi:hydrogenase-1 operon protein HyaF
MNLNDIAVHVVGPGSQPDESEQMSYIDMPGEMQTYVPPMLDDTEAFRTMPDAREAMDWLKAALADHLTDRQPKIADLSALDNASREVVNQILGEGEVSLTATGRYEARCQEAVLAGVWRTVLLDPDGNPGRDLLEVGASPTVASSAADAERPVDTTPPDNAAEIPNALPILVELEAAVREYADSGRVHSINLSLLPLSEQELEFLDERLGRGPVDILSRAYGKCQIISTATANVWWVRYYNAMGALILNCLEVVNMPEVVCAASEDLGDSRERLDEILAPYWPDAG